MPPSRTAVPMAILNAWHCLAELPIILMALPAWCAQSGDLIHARLKVALAGLDHGLEFASGHTLDAESARQIPEAMIGRLFNDGDLPRLHRILITKKPPAPSVRRVREGNAAKR
jgi:hypothetical protein